MEQKPWITPLPETAGPALDIVARLRDTGRRAYLVGGAVRDLVLGIEPGDWDVATDARPDELTDLFPDARTVGAAFGVVVVPTADGHVEVATFREDGLYMDGRRPADVTYADDPARDAARRDFTVNALYLDPIDGMLLDPVGGLVDARTRTLKAVGDPERRFREDGLRLLRAARFSARLGLTIEANTLSAMERSGDMIDLLAPERIGTELATTMTAPRASAALSILRETGLLRRFLPEVDDLHGVEQPPDHHPEGCVWTHTMLMLDALEEPPLELALAVLLHDVGKPRCATTEGGRIRFHGHARIGAVMTDTLLSRLRFSNRVVRSVASLVDRHMGFLDVRRMKDSTLKRFLSGPDFDLLLELHRLDRISSRGDLSAWEFCRDALAAMSEEDLRPAPLLTGRDLMRMGYPRGPLVGVILEEVETAQLDGEIASRDEAEAWVRERHPRD